MKKPKTLPFFLLISFLIFSFGTIFSQPAEFRCGYDDLLKQVSTDEELKINYDTLLNSIRRQALLSRGAPALRVQPNNYTIPVVVHLIGQDASGLTDAQVIDQIQILNQAFSDNLGSTSTVADNAQIEFCLAKKGPSGTVITGIERYTSASANTIAENHHMGTTGSNSQQSLGTLAYYDPSRYLNIWVVEQISLSSSPYSNVVLGYAPFPLAFLSGQTYYLDGVVMRLDAFGTGSSFPNYNLGRTLIHEVGHYLGLFHTFHNSCLEVVNSLACNAPYAGDECCDTPPVANPNQNNCLSGNSCAESPDLPDQVENHMDYGYDACRTTFSEDQADRMHAVIQLYRSTLVSYSNLLLTGLQCLPAGLDPTFVSDLPFGSTQLCVGDPIGFTPLPGAATYTWNFPGGTPSTSTQQNPTGITFSSSGMKNISLTVTDGLGGSADYVLDLFVIDCTPYSGDQAHWYFGKYGVLDFTNGYAQEGIQSAMYTREACASISDNLGGLLFYTDGRNVYNKNHNPINGTNPVLNGSPNQWNASNSISSAQGALIVPKPNSTGIYYIFTTSDVDFGGAITYGLSYYEVDMSLNGGLGQVTTPPQGFNPTENYVTTEHLTAIPHCNGTDYWIVVKPMANSATTLNNPGPLFSNPVNEYILAYQLSSTGLAGSPIASHVGNLGYSLSPGVNNSWIGQFDVSRDKKWMAISEMNTASVNILSFDCQSGEFKKIKTLSGVDGYSVCFSPNKKALYASAGYNIKQFDLTKFSACNTTIPVKTLSLPGNFQYRSLQLGPDDRIYISRNYGLYGGSSTNSFPIINYPDNINSTSTSNECGLNALGVYLTNYHKTRSGLPNMIDATTIPPPTDFAYCIKNCGEVYFENLGCGINFDWDFGDGNTLSGSSGMVPGGTNGGATSGTYQNPVHTYSGPGIYTVTFTIDSGTPVSHSISIIIPPAPTITGPNPVCVGSTGPSTYYCPPGYDCAWTATNASPTSGIGNSFPVSWTAFPATLSLTITDPETGCSNSSTITITETTKAPNANAGPDVAICLPNSTVLNGSGNGTMVWTPSTGLSCTTCPNPVANPTTTTTYTLTVSNGCGSSSSQVTVTIGAWDLVVKDASDDVGAEPNTVSTNVWNGDIWNCTNSVNCNTMENPEYKTSGDNYIRVRVENMGCITSDPASLHLYWTIGRAFEYWPEHWYDISLEPTNDIGGITGGKEITVLPASTTPDPITIPPVLPGPSNAVILTKAWEAPNPADYPTQGATPMLCFLARIISPNDPMFNEQSGLVEIYQNVYHNNNVATINAILVDLEPNGPTPNDDDYYSFFISNPTPEVVDYGFSIEDLTTGSSTFFNDGGSMKVSLVDVNNEYKELARAVANQPEDLERIASLELKPDDLVLAKVSFSHPGYRDRKKQGRYTLLLNNHFQNSELAATKFTFDIRVKKKKKRCWLLFWKN